MAPEVYNIEYDVIQKWPRKRITSKTMLYKCAPESYSIENDVIQKWPTKHITLKTMLYKMAPKAYNIENDVIQKTQPKNTDFSPKKHVIHFLQVKKGENARTTERMKLEVYLLLNDAVIKL